MTVSRDTSKCGTVQGAFAQAPAAKARIFADLADALLPLVVAIVVPRVKKNLVPSASEGPPDDRQLENLWREIGSGADMSPEEELALRLLGRPGILDPTERDRIAQQVAADDARKLAGVWLMKLGPLVGAGTLSALPAWRGDRSRSCALRPADCSGFDALTIDEANRILGSIDRAPAAERIFDLVNAYLAL